MLVFKRETSMHEEMVIERMGKDCSDYYSQ